MVTRVGGHFVMYINNESLCCTPESDIILCVSYISILKNFQNTEGTYGLSSKPVALSSGELVFLEL